MTTQTTTALVDPAWLAAHRCDPGLRVVEVDVSPTAYQAGHIDGAVLWNIYTDLRDPDCQLLNTAAVERLIARSGIGPQTTVVFYGYAPALGYWLLKRYGHANARLLNCSRDAWRAGGLPWTATTTDPEPATYRLSDDAGSVHADAAAVRARIADPRTTLLDVRSQEEYEGRRFWPSGAMQPGGRAGHIPGAIHQPVDGLHDASGAFLPNAELRRVFTALDPDGETELITYCTVGGRAATAWFVLTELLGHANVRVYHGSWAEWGLLPGAPIQTNPPPTEEANTAA